MDLFDLYAKVTLDSSGFDAGIDDAVEKGSSFGSKLKTGLATAAKVGAAALTAAAAGVTALTKASLDQYAEYEQLTGGVETLFKESSDVVMQYAANAYKTAGMSANEYMTTVTSFSASLLQSLGGDTDAAAEKADQAITDMSDNANKMGTTIDMIQNAYNGFAKQNYTMLDNLKLGYGGTKEEMQRLLDDAEALSGVEYDISSYADVVDAIHVVQTEMGITGTTAAEASETISGSLAAAKSAFTNLITGVADENQNLDTLMGNFVDSVTTAAGNILPRIGTIFKGIGSLVTGLAPVVSEAIVTLVTDVLPGLLTAGGQMLAAIAEGLLSQSGAILESALNLVVMLSNGLIDAVPQLVDGAAQLVISLAEWISEYSYVLAENAATLIASLASGLLKNAPALLESAVLIVESLVDGIAKAFPELVKSGGDMLDEMVTGVLNGIPDMIKRIPKIVESFLGYITENLPDILDKGVEILNSLVTGIINTIPEMIRQAPAIIKSFVQFIVDSLPEIVDAGIDILLNLIVGIIKAIPDLVAAIPQVIGAIVSGVFALMSTINDIGNNIVKGIWDGITGAAQWLTDKVTGFFGDIVQSVKDALDIHSPSRVFAGIGEYMMQGLASGIDDSATGVMQSADAVIGGISSRFGTLDGVSADVNVNSNGVASQSASSTVNGLMTALSGMTGGGTYNINLVCDDNVLASTVFQPLVNYGAANGTPILAT